MFSTDLARAYWRLGASVARMTMEAQAVIAMRMMGMAGFWPMKPAELRRMVHEKPEAFARAGFAAGAAAMRGAAPHAVMEAGLKPISARASRNAKRLAKW